MEATVTIRISTTLKTELEKEAKAEDRALSNYIRRILEARKQKKK